MLVSLLDNDLYKFTMMQVVFHHFSDVMVEYQLQYRHQPFDFRPYAQQIENTIKKLGELQLTEEELSYLSSLGYFKQDFVDYLRGFKLEPTYVKIKSTDKLELIIEGPWLATILFEVPLLAILSELHSQINYPDVDFQQGKQRLQQKIDLVKTSKLQSVFRFIDFGTRRRFSFAWQRQMLAHLKAELPENLSGTSNLYFAKLFNLQPMGTMAHEYVQACQVLAPELLHHQQFALEIWLQEYEDKLSIALTDTITLETFLKEFNKPLAEAYAGVRQDSGDPIAWGKRMLSHYAQLGIDAKQKKMIFSDALTFPLALKICESFYQSAQPGFGIGTNLMNDLGCKPIATVIKITRCNGKPVVKISDDRRKLSCCEPDYLPEFMRIFRVD